MKKLYLLTVLLILLQCLGKAAPNQQGQLYRYTTGPVFFQAKNDRALNFTACNVYFSNWFDSYKATIDFCSNKILFTNKNLIVNQVVN